MILSKNIIKCWRKLKMIEKDLEELVQRIQSLGTELNNVEVKEAHLGCPHKLYDTISAFSNAQGGGIILFGLSEKDDFAITGVYDAADLQKKITEQCKQMQPVVRALFTCAIIEGKVIVSAEIPEIDAADKPCFYMGKGRLTGSYIRVGDSDEPMTEYEVYSYDAFRKKYQDDVRSVEQAELSLLDKERLEEYQFALKKKKERLSKMTAKEIYELMRILRKGVPTVMGILMFGSYPQGLFPQWCITAVVVPGETIGETGSLGERFIDNRRLDGTIPEMLDGAVRFVQKNMSIRTIVDSVQGKRMDLAEYPIQAVRELILNALLHRDYSIHTEGMPIQLIMFRNRLEIRNPGGLYGRLRISDLGKVQPDTRNPALAVVMEDLDLTENRYSGIPTIYKVMRENGKKEPVFLNQRGEFRAILYNETRSDQVGDESVHEEKNVMKFCEVPRSREEIAAYLGLKTTYHAMRQYIRPLLEEGKLKMMIPDKPKSKYQKFVTV